MTRINKACYERGCACYDDRVDDDAVEVILAQPEQEQEPVAYAVYHRMGGSKSLHWPEQHSPNGDESEYRLVPLYATPPQRTWVELSDEQIEDCYKQGGIGRAIQLFKEKNT